MKKLFFCVWGERGEGRGEKINLIGAYTMILCRDVGTNLFSLTNSLS